MRNQTRATGIGVALALTALCAAAQTSTTPPGQTPTGVGVTQQTANDANQKAVPRSDTGTVVRTGRTAGEAARSAASSVGDSARSAATSVGNGARNAAAGASAAMSDTSGSSTGDGGATGMRRARGDRN